MFTSVYGKKQMQKMAGRDIITECIKLVYPDILDQSILVNVIH